VFSIMLAQYLPICNEPPVSRIFLHCSTGFVNPARCKVFDASLRNERRSCSYVCLSCSNVWPPTHSFSCPKQMQISGSWVWIKGRRWSTSLKNSVTGYSFRHDKCQ
jgi:hypothetical protein